MKTLEWKKITKEVTNKQLLFVAASATNNNRSKQGERHRQYHQGLIDIFESIGFSINVSSDLSTLLVKPENKFVYGIHSHSWFNGKEVFTSALCEYYGIPYLGARPTVRAVAEDKKLFNHFVKSLGIPCPLQSILLKDINLPDFSGPWILKPRNGIASQYVSYIENRSDLICEWNKIPNHIKTSTDFLFEKYIDGRNISVPLIEGLDNSQLPIFEEFDDNKQNILTFEGKRRMGGNYRSVIYEGQNIEEIRKLAHLVEQEIKPYDYARLDFRIENITGKPYLIDLNIICNLSETSVVSKSALSTGIQYQNLIEHILANSFERQSISPISLSSEVD